MSVLKSRPPVIGIDWLTNCPDAQLAAEFQQLMTYPNVRGMFMQRDHLDGNAQELLVMLDHERVDTPQRKAFVDLLANIRARLLATRSHTELNGHPLLLALGGAHSVSLGAATDEPEYSLNLGQHAYQPRPTEGMKPTSPFALVWLFVNLQTVDGTLVI